jgi:hypothetical protein
MTLSSDVAAPAATAQPSPGAAGSNSGTGAGCGSSGNRAHLNILRDELRDSVMEEDRLLDRMAELAQTRSALKVQVQQKEAEAEGHGIRRRKEKLEATRQSFQL